MPKVSIIIPVYNTEQFLKKCLDSVAAQTLEDIEIICVNDGSTDSSLAILEDYAKQDARIQIINKENEGAVSARKAGVLAATGEYIGYVDSDDWIEPEMFERLYETAVGYQVDMVSSGYFLEGSYTTRHLDAVDGGLYTEDRIGWLCDNTIYRLSKKETGLRGAVWCKLFRRDILTEVQMDVPNSVTIAEDKLCIIHYMLHCKSAYIMEEAYYHWCIHGQSVSRKENPDYLLCVHEVYKYLIQLYGHKGFSEQMRVQAELYIMELLALGMNSRLGFQNRQLLWIDPYWLDALPQNCKVMIYGGGEYGAKYLNQLRSRKDIVLVKELGFSLPSQEEVQKVEFDYIVIAIKNQGKAEQIKSELLTLGIEEEKIRWYAQPEMFWRYAQAEGLLEEQV